MAGMKFVMGNILTPNKKGGCVVVCHQVNCKGVMGAGLAERVKKLHPGVYACYKDKCALIKTGIGGLGDVQFCSALEGYGYVVANIFGQDNCGREVDGRGKKAQYTDYDALRKAFTHIAQAFPNDIVRIPYKMGCGLGGGDWKVVKQIIKETLVANGVSVEIWQYSA